MDKKKQKFKMAESCFILNQLKSYSKTSWKKWKVLLWYKGIGNMFTIETSIEKHVENNN